jgi:hypothetical protein
MMTMNQFFATMKAGFYDLLMKPRTAQQDNDRAVSPATTRALRAVAYHRCNGYNPVVTYQRRFG